MTRAGFPAPVGGPAGTTPQSACNAAVQRANPRYAVGTAEGLADSCGAAANGPYFQFADPMAVGAHRDRSPQTRARLRADRPYTTVGDVASFAATGLQVLLVIALGGVSGAAARFAVQCAFAALPGAFPWATLIINLTGSLLVGVLMVVIDMGPAHPLARPFLGVGLLGGYTAFSTYTADTPTLVLADRPGLTLVYLVGTPLTALLAVDRSIASARRHKGASPSRVAQLRG